MSQQAESEQAPPTAIDPMASPPTEIPALTANPPTAASTPIDTPPTATRPHATPPIASPPTIPIRSAIQSHKSQWRPTGICVISSTAPQAASANTYFAGGCDAVTANNVPQSYLAALSTGNHGQPYRDFTIAPYLGVYFAVVNTKKYDNVHLRRALALSLDRARIAGFLHGGEIGVASYTPGAPIASLSVLIYNFSGSPFAHLSDLAWAASLVLVVLVLALNVLAQVIIRRPKEL